MKITGVPPSPISYPYLAVHDPGESKRVDPKEILIINLIEIDKTINDDSPTASHPMTIEMQVWVSYLSKNVAPYRTKNEHEYYRLPVGYEVKLRQD